MRSTTITIYESRSLSNTKRSILTDSECIFDYPNMNTTLLSRCKDVILYKASDLSDALFTPSLRYGALLSSSHHSVPYQIYLNWKCVWIHYISPVRDHPPKRHPLSYSSDDFILGLCRSSQPQCLNRLAQIICLIICNLMYLWSSHMVICSSSQVPSNWHSFRFLLIYQSVPQISNSAALVRSCSLGLKTLHKKYTSPNLSLRY